MPFMTASDGCSIFYRFDGDESAPVVLLSNSLGTTHAMWEPQMAALTARYRVLRYDNRGHGQSAVPPAPYAVDRIGTDAKELIAGLNLSRVLFCGLSLGGIVGMWLGANAPEMLRRAVLANTGARIGPRAMWDERLAIIAQDGLDKVSKAVVQRWLTAPYIAEHPEAASMLAAMIAATPQEGYVGAACAVRDVDLRADLPRITVPVLVIAGSHDMSTPVALGEQIVAGMPGARLAILEAAHLSNIEQADQFNTLIRNFFDAA